MDELNIYYHIVPTNDGCVYLCQDKYTGEYYLHSKTSDVNKESLVFSSELAAEEWIASRAPLGHFKPEWFATADVIEKFSDMRCNYG